MVLMDATALLLLLNEDTPPPRHPDTKELLTDAHERITTLVNYLALKGEKIIIAAPVLAELLVRAEEAGAGYVHEFSTSSRFKMCAFDQKAAVEHAVYTRKAIENGDKFDGSIDKWAKIKFDRQIVAIALAEGAHTIYTDDKNLGLHAEKQGLTVVKTHELQLNVQPDLFTQAQINPEVSDVAEAIEAEAAEDVKPLEAEAPIEPPKGKGDEIV